MRKAMARSRAFSCYRGAHRADVCAESARGAADGAGTGGARGRWRRRELRHVRRVVRPIPRGLGRPDTARHEPGRLHGVPTDRRGASVRGSLVGVDPLAAHAAGASPPGAVHHARAGTEFPDGQAARPDTRASSSPTRSTASTAETIARSGWTAARTRPTTPSTPGTASRLDAASAACSWSRPPT